MELNLKQNVLLIIPSSIKFYMETNDDDCGFHYVYMRKMRGKCSSFITDYIKIPQYTFVNLRI